MTYAGNYIGADGLGYPELAALAVQNAHVQQRSPYYGYIRSGIKEKIYLLPQLEDARVWFDQHMQLQPEHDYAAAFSAEDLRAPIPGMEHFMRTTVGCVTPIGCIPPTPPIGCDPQVGNWPFLLGLPLGGLAGYFLRRWQEQHPGLAFPGVPPGQLPAPKIPPDAMALAPIAPNVGGWLDIVGQSYGGQPFGVPGAPAVNDPWLNLVGQDYDQGYDYGQNYDGQGYNGYTVGGPWLDIVGQAQGDDDATRRRLTQALARAAAEAASRDIVDVAARVPDVTYWVWWLAAPAAPMYGGVTVEPGSQPEPYTTLDDAMARVRELGQQQGVIARAVFDKSSPNWPHAITWSRSEDPAHDPMIAQYVAANQPQTQAAGTYMGAATVVGAAIDDVRRRAQSLASKREGDVIGVIHTLPDNLWHQFAFLSPDDADDWLNLATKDQSAYTYAAYFDKEGDSWPDAYIEKIGGFRTPAVRRTGSVGRWRSV